MEFPKQYISQVGHKCEDSFRWTLMCSNEKYFIKIDRVKSSSVKHPAFWFPSHKLHYNSATQLRLVLTRRLSDQNRVMVYSSFVFACVGIFVFTYLCLSLVCICLCIQHSVTVIETGLFGPAAHLWPQAENCSDCDFFGTLPILSLVLFSVLQWTRLMH